MTLQGTAFRAATLLLAALPVFGQVKVWEGTLELPTYEEDLPNPNPPFDLFATSRFSNYPYTIRDNLTNRRVTHAWRALYLENEYLKCSVLPDIGGHLYSCTDKVNGQEIFYANPSIKKANIGYRGAWAAFGIEFNFPVSHNWMSMSPVDFASHQNADGSASVTVGNIDRVYGMQWRVELTLRPASMVLEQKVQLYNRSGLRHRFYWWNNAGVEVWDDSRVYYPMRFTASHGFTDVDTWPVNRRGRDVSLIANQLDGPVSEFVHGSREPFMGVYHPRTNAGTVHYADYAELPAKKIWSWGVNPDGLDWRKTLSDNNSAYVEVQGGLFRNQETYAFLEPQKTLEFTEYWMPVRDIGGISRANLHGVMHFLRKESAAGKVTLTAGLNVNHALADARVRILDGTKTLFEQRLPLDPRRTFSHAIGNLPADRQYTFEVADARGRVLLTHTEGRYDWTPADQIKTGPQKAYEFPPVEKRTEGDFVELGKDEELNGLLLRAYETYTSALKRFPQSFEIHKAIGRLAVELMRYKEAVEHLRLAQQRISNDDEIHYYLGQAFKALGQLRDARTEFEGAQRMPAFRGAANLELARLSARQNDFRRALEEISAALKAEPQSIRAGEAEVALLRRLDNASAARERLNYWRKIDPTSSTLRFEHTKLGGRDDGLWSHLAGDPERVLAMADDYMALGFWNDALDVLSRKYPAVSPLETEPGTPLPQDHPMVSYYAGYAREMLKQSGKADFQRASRLSTAYVFPSRPSGLAVLGKALEVNPGDATAHFLMGSIQFANGQVEESIALWQQARKLNPEIPVLHRNLGRTLLDVKGEIRQGVDVLREGLKADPRNMELYLSLNRGLSLLRRPATERTGVLRQYPDQKSLPQSLLYELILSLAESGQAEEAEKLFHDRFFAREEGGINVRQVWVEVQLRKALALARSGRGKEAVAVLGRAAKPVEGLAFTNDGMDAFTQGARFEYYSGVVREAAGDKEGARAAFQRAKSGGGPGYQLGFAALASRKLDGSVDSALTSRIGAALARGSGGSRNASMAAYSRGVLLQAMGRSEEAESALLSALKAPDRLLAHYLTRIALEEKQ
ncbi:MAG: DUF5107 domain-containing protein [Bryobacterales bacterium]|nr:DUF5107 domain-containing protein [Bryobacterales bacterium]